jgi:hypothetical protein
MRRSLEKPHVLRPFPAPRGCVSSQTRTLARPPTPQHAPPRQGSPRADTIAALPPAGVAFAAAFALALHCCLVAAG